MVDLLQPVNFRLSRVFLLFQYLVLVTFYTIYFVFYLLPIFVLVFPFVRSRRSYFRISHRSHCAPFGVVLSQTLVE